MSELPRRTGLTLAQVQLATNTASATAVVAAGLDGGPWAATSVRRTSVRLEPASAYWATYRVRVERRSHAGSSTTKR